MKTSKTKKSAIVQLLINSMAIEGYAISYNAAEKAVATAFEEMKTRKFRRWMKKYCEVQVQFENEFLDCPFSSERECL